MGQPNAAEEQRRKEAFARFVLPEVDTLYRVALSITRRPADAEDLVQDTLLRAYRAIDGFDGRHPRSWLLTILRNTHINRNRRRRPELLRRPAETLAQLEAAGPGRDNPEDLVVGPLFDTAVQASYEALSPRHRRIIELVDIDGLTYQEAAGVLGVPVGTVMSRLHRARARIRRRLEPHITDKEQP